MLELTKNYIKAFNNKDLNAIANLVDENFILEDPAVKHLEGKNVCLEAINSLFTKHKKLSFEALNIYVDKNISLIEFKLKLDDIILQGVDIITWQNNKIKELRAYLHEVK